MKLLLCILTFFISIQSSGQTYIFQTWISPGMDYLEIAASKSKAGFTELAEYTTKLKRNLLTLKSRHKTLKFKILKCENDSLILTSLNLSAKYFLEQKDTLLFTSKNAFFNDKIDFKTIVYVSADFGYNIDSTGLLTLIGNKKSNVFVGTYTSQLSKEVLGKINHFIQEGDITKVPFKLPDPFDSQNSFYLYVYYFDRRNNFLFDQVALGSDPPYILKDFINYLKVLPENIQLKKLDKTDK